MSQVKSITLYSHLYLEQLRYYPCLP